MVTKLALGYWLVTAFTSYPHGHDKPPHQTITYESKVSMAECRRDLSALAKAGVAAVTVEGIELKPGVYADCLEEMAE